MNGGTTTTTIGIGTREARKPRLRPLTQLRERFRQRRLLRAERAYSMRASRIGSSSIPGSEHAHLLRPRRY